MDLFYTVKIVYEKFPYLVTTLGSFRTIEEAVTKMLWKITNDDKFDTSPSWFDEFIDSNGEIIIKDYQPAILYNRAGSNSYNRMWIEPTCVPYKTESNYMELLSNLKKKQLDVEPVDKKCKIGD